MVFVPTAPPKPVELIPPRSPSARTVLRRGSGIDEDFISQVVDTRRICADNLPSTPGPLNDSDLEFPLTPLLGERISSPATPGVQELRLELEANQPKPVKRRSKQRLNIPLYVGEQKFTPEQYHVERHLQTFVLKPTERSVSKVHVRSFPTELHQHTSMYSTKKTETLKLTFGN